MRQRKPRTNAKRPWQSVMGRLALIVSLWHAPLPMVHAHGADADDSVGAVALVDHLVQYHPDVTVNSHADFGWHWHLVPPPANHPGDEPSNGNCPFCPQDTQDTQLQSQQTTGSLLVTCTWSVTGWLSNSSIPAVHVVRATQTQFLDTYLGSVSLGTLLRVARC